MFLFRIPFFQLSKGYIRFSKYFVFVLLTMAATKNRLFLEMGYVKTIWFNAIPYVYGNGHAIYDWLIHWTYFTIISARHIYTEISVRHSGDRYNAFLAKRTWYGMYNIYTLISRIPNNFHIWSRWDMRKYSFHDYKYQHDNDQSVYF